MNKQPIRNAAAEAEAAIRELDKALDARYCAHFKLHIDNAAFRLESAARELRIMQG